MKNRTNTPLYRRKAVIAAGLILALLTGAHLTFSWPRNFLGKVVYRILGKQLPPTRSEDLANVKQFLIAKRMLDKKEYLQARAKLEKLKTGVQPNFLFFREIYFYLGYIYDVQGDFKKEEALYSELQGKDVVLSKFLYGLYFFRHGQDSKARDCLEAAVLLERKYHGLNVEFKNLLQTTLIQISRQGESTRTKTR